MKRSLVVVLFSCFGTLAYSDEQEKVSKSRNFKRSDEITVLLTEDPSDVYRVKTNVIDILPNGSLKIYGEKVDETPRLTSTYTLSGIIHPSEISLRNTIRSEIIANLRITKIQRDKQKANEDIDWDSADNLEIVNALGPIQKKPDRLTIVVKVSDDLTANIHEARYGKHIGLMLIVGSVIVGVVLLYLKRLLKTLRTENAADSLD